MAVLDGHVREEREVEMDVDASPADVLVDLDADEDVDVDVYVEVDSIAEDGEFEPVVASVALVLTVIDRQSMSDIVLFHVFEQDEHTRRSRVSSSRCCQNKVFGSSCTATPRSHKSRVADLGTSNVRYACSGTEQKNQIRTIPPNPLRHFCFQQANSCLSAYHRRI